jgi:hypothetical protein
MTKPLSTIKSAVIFSAQYEIDAEDEYQRNHHPQRKPRRFDERPETTANLTFTNFYRKEFIQVLDVQIHNLTANVKAACDILTPAINLLLPPFNKEPEPEELEALVKMLPETLQPDVSALNVELTMFRHHCQANKPDVKSLAEAAHCAKVGKNLIKNLTKRILNIFETTYQILGPVLIFDLHNLVFRTVAQEHHWPLQYKMGMKKPRTYNMQTFLNNIVTIRFNEYILYYLPLPQVFHYIDAGKGN